MDTKEVTRFRACIERMNYLAIDRPDIMYAVKELARKMSKPNNANLERMRRLARFLKGRPLSVTWYSHEEEPNTLEVFTDSDWAGCRVTRRSTSGGCAMAGTHFIKAWSKTQATSPLSVAEAELYAVVMATSECIGITNIMNDFGRNMGVCILTDASAALGSFVAKVWDECVTWTLTCFGYRTNARSRRLSTARSRAAATLPTC